VSESVIEGESKTVPGLTRNEPPALAIEGASFAYGERPAVRDVSLEIPPGDFVGLIGPNGAGKTTLVRLLAGILTPSTGRVRLGDRDLAELPRREAARRIAFVPQETVSVFPYRVREAVALGRYPHLGSFAFETDADWDAVNAALAATETTWFQDRFLHELSGGERQRVLLARALAQTPDILLLDEPTSHLDLDHQSRFLDLIATSRGEGRGATSVVFVSHDINVIAHRARRLVLLHDGRVAADGAPADVLTARRLAEVYSTRLRLVPDPETGIPFVFPASPHRSRDHD